MNLKENFKMDKCKKVFCQFKENALKKSGKVKGELSQGLAKASLQIKRFTEKTGEAAKSARQSFDAFWDQHLGRLNRRAIFAGGAGLLGAAVVIGAVVTLTSTSVYQVKAGDTLLGYVPDPETVTAAVSTVKKDVAKKAGVKEVLVEEKKIEVDSTSLREKDVDFLEEKDLAEKIIDADLCRANGWAVVANGEPVAVTTTKKNAEKILEGVKSAYLTSGSEVVSAEIKDAIEITKSAVEVSELKSVEDAVQYLVTGRETQVEYTVAQGETLWDIASAHDMSPYDLIALNADLEPETIQVGQKIKMTAFVPYLTVVTTEKITSQEPVPFQTVYEASKDLNVGITRVKTEGVQGLQETVSQVIKQNGIVVTSAAVSTTVLQAPQNEVALQGTKATGGSTSSGSRYVASVASANYGMGGTLQKPAPVNVSSSFGASRGSRRHTGVDFRNPKGTPIVAAASGTVTKASYSGSCGLMVKIDHGNGMETWYEHCDTVCVTPGQKVSAGQSIATVGKTGNATGYCLHFEVRINGVPQNPLNFL